MKPERVEIFAEKCKEKEKYTYSELVDFIRTASGLPLTRIEWMLHKFRQHPEFEKQFKIKQDDIKPEQVFFIIGFLLDLTNSKQREVRNPHFLRVKVMEWRNYQEIYF